MNGEVAGTGLLLGGRYRLVDPVGAGGMAVVWRARDEVLARTVAVKMLAGQHLDDAASRDRIRHEAQAAAALSHPNIAQIHDYGVAVLAGATTPYVVMELVPGDTLLQRMHNGPMAPRYAMRVCSEIAAALAAAHGEGLVHRDIKPANVILAPTGAKVVDFGIAAMVAPGRAADDDFEVLGTPAYLAPERLIDDVVVPASDVYALGVLLYRLLAGHSPWTSETTTQMLSAHVYIDPAPLDPAPGVPPHITKLCNSCLAKDPAARPSAREVATVLGQAAEPAAVVAGPPPQRRSRRVALVAAAALIAVAGAGAWMFLPDDPATDAGQPAAAGTVAPASSSAKGPATRRPASAAAPVLSPAPPGVADPAAPAPTGPAPTQVITVTGAPAAPPPAGDPPPGGSTTAPPAPGTPAPEPEPEPEPVERTLTSNAGSVRATCEPGDEARILSWTPTRPYKVQSAERGPAAAPAVAFKHGGSRVTMTVTCSGGVPDATVAS